MTSDPPRLLDDPTLGAALRTDLGHAAEAQLQGFDFAAGLAKLQSATGTGAVATVATTSVTAKLAVAGLVAAAAAAVWLGTRDPSPTTTARATTPTSVADEAVEAVEKPQTEPMNSEAPSKVVAPVVAAPPAAPPVEASALLPAATDAEDDDEIPPAEAGAQDDPSGVDEPQEPTRKRVRKAPAPETVEAHAETPPEPPAIDDAVLREARAVAQARAKLSGDPARALALLEDAEREFPAGQLVEERKALAIQALAALGRLDEAKRRAEAFLAQYGKGAHAAAVRRAIAAER